MELYLKVRLACSGGMSRRQAAKHFNISRDSVAKMQGNRVKQSSGDDAFKEIVVPSGDFSSEAQRVLSGGHSDEVVGHVLERGEIGRGMICSNPAFVVAKDHVHNPVRLFSIAQWLLTIGPNCLAGSAREVM